MHKLADALAKPEAAEPSAERQHAARPQHDGAADAQCRRAGRRPRPVEFAALDPGPRGWGVLAFTTSAALDLYNATQVDLRTREFNFNGRQFLVAAARSQSANAVGFGFSALAVTAAVGVGVAGAPLVIIGLGVGVFVQLVWNWSGAADASAGYMDQALR